MTGAAPRRRRWGRPDPKEWPAGAAPSWAFRRAVAVGSLCVLAGFAIGRPDVVLLGLPFALYAALAWGRAARPQVRAELSLDRDRVLEGETVVATVRLETDVDLDAVTIAVASPYALRAVDSLTHTVTVRAGEPYQLDVRMQALRWGRHRLGPVRVSPYGPLLGSATAALEVPGATLTVLGAQEDFRAADLTPYALAASGGHHSRRHGDGLEFAAVRPFAFGDRVRQVNWRVTARLGDLHVNDTLTDRMSEVVVLLDTACDAGRSGGVHGAVSSLDVTVRAAGAIATHYLRAGDTVSLVEFGGRIRELSGLTGRGTVTRALDWLVDTSPGTLGWDVQARRIGPQLLPARALAVVLSPLLEQRCIELLAALRQRGQAIVVVDTQPADALPPPRRVQEEMAQRIWRLERDRTAALLGDVGIPVVGWVGAGSIDAVLRDVVAMSRAPRAVAR